MPIGLNGLKVILIQIKTEKKSSKTMGGIVPSWFSYTALDGGYTLIFFKKIKKKKKEVYR